MAMSQFWVLHTYINEYKSLHSEIFDLHIECFPNDSKHRRISEPRLQDRNLNWAMKTELDMHSGSSPTIVMSYALQPQTRK